ncbi:MAG: PCYCGC motif-containing (lipo)protein [Candidatus Hydrothermarchaeaceae archaeon]
MEEQKSSQYLLPIAILFILAIALYSVKSSGGGDALPATKAPLASPPPLTLVPVSLPDYATQSKQIEDAYIIATQIPDVLEKIPCYCSCGGIGHKSLRNCYINDDGTFGNHGSFCQICINEAYDVYTWYIQGVPVAEIRKRIDEKYGSGFGKGTDTPPV